MFRYFGNRTAIRVRLGTVLIAVLGLVGAAGVAAATMQVQLALTEQEINRVLERAFTAASIGDSGIPYQGGTLVVWRPRLDLGTGQLTVHLPLGVRGADGSQKLLRTLSLPATVPAVELSSDQLDAAIDSVGQALDFLEEPARTEAADWLTSLGLPIFEGSVLDTVKFPLNRNDLAIKADQARISAWLVEARGLIVTLEVDLSLVSLNWQLARDYQDRGNLFNYKILTAGGATYEIVRLEAREKTTTNILGQTHTGRLKTFATSGLLAGAFAEATAIAWNGVWNDGHATVAGTTFYFAGSLRNDTDYVQFYSPYINFFGFSGWAYHDLTVDALAN